MAVCILLIISYTYKCVFFFSFYCSSLISVNLVSLECPTVHCTNYKWIQRLSVCLFDLLFNWIIQLRTSSQLQWPPGHEAATGGKTLASLFTNKPPKSLNNGLPCSMTVPALHSVCSFFFSYKDKGLWGAPSHRCSHKQHDALFFYNCPALTHSCNQSSQLMGVAGTCVHYNHFHYSYIKERGGFYESLPEPVT